MNIIDNTINDYATEHTTAESPLLKQLNEETYRDFEMPQMLSGHLQGRFLSMISKMLKPRRILEIGTYTGYSAICLCEGLAENGKLYTIDINNDLRTVAMKYFRKSGVEDKIEFIAGNALEIIPSLNAPFDLVFIDADKSNYSNYFDLVFDKVSGGGYILADNVLWSGRVTEDEKDNRTKAIDAYNKKIMADNRVENILLPIRDGIMISRKIV